MPKIYGEVIVNGETYEDDEISSLVGKDITGWRYGSDASVEDCDIVVSGKVFFGPEALEKALKHIGG